MAGATPYGLTVGNPKAPHQVIIYEDFICPYCGSLENASHAGLAAAAAAGKVYIDYRPFHLLPEGYSSQAAAAFFAVKDLAGPTQAKALHDILYANQPSEQGPYPSQAQIITEVNQAVTDPATQQKVDAAINAGTYDRWVPVATDQAEKNAGITATPTVYLDGKPFTNAVGNATGVYAATANLGTNLVAAVQ